MRVEAEHRERPDDEDRDAQKHQQDRQAPIAEEEPDDALGGDARDVVRSRVRADPGRRGHAAGSLRAAGAPPSTPFNITIPNGGSVSAIENGRPCVGRASAVTAPKLPWPLPP